MRSQITLLVSLVSIALACSVHAQSHNPSPSDLLAEYAKGVTEYREPPSAIKLGHGDIQQPDPLKASDRIINFNVIPYSWPKGNEYLQKKYIICDRAYTIGWSSEIPDGSIWADNIMLMAQSPKGWVIFRPFSANGIAVHNLEFWGGGDYAKLPLYPYYPAMLSSASDKGINTFDFKVPAASGVCTSMNINGKAKKVALLHALIIAQNPVKPNFNNSAIVIKAK